MSTAGNRNFAIRNDTPPNWAEIHAALPDVSLDHQIFAWVPYIYWKHQDTRPLQQDLIAHELKHHDQQDEMGPVRWWQRYLNDPQFRLDQEIEAIRAQLACARGMTRDRTKIFNLARTQAQNLASPVYGGVITFQEAYDKITA